MSKVIVLANQKGGVGKTTTTINLAYDLARSKKNVLVIDLDPQGNTTSGFGIDKRAVENSIYEVLIGECSPIDAIGAMRFRERKDNSDVKLWLLPSKLDLAAAEIELSNTEGKEYLLRDSIASVRGGYDYILIDCPPSLGLLTVNALTTADSVLIPVQCEYYALEGLAQLLNTISLVQERLNEKLIIEGIVFTMYDSHTKLSRQVVEDVRDNLDVYIFEQPVPRNVRLAEAPSYGEPIEVYDRKSNGAKAYKKLAKELLKKENPSEDN